MTIARPSSFSSKKRRFNNKVNGRFHSQKIREDDDNDNLCPVCEDTCTCGASIANKSTKADTTKTNPIAISSKKAVIKPSLYCTDDDLTCSSSLSDGYLSDDSADFVFGYTDIELDLKPIPKSENTSMTTNFLGFQTTMQSVFLTAPKSQVHVNKPAMYLNDYGAYYMSEPEESDYESDYLDVNINIEDYLNDNVCMSVSPPTAEPCELLDRWEKIPISAFFRSRRPSAPMIEISKAMKSSQSSSNSTLMCVPESSAHTDDSWSIQVMSNSNTSDPEAEEIHAKDYNHSFNVSSPLWSPDNDLKLGQCFWHEV